MNAATIIEWVLSNLLWEVLGLFLIAFLSLFKIFWISIKLLNQNRDTRGNAWGQHFADRFIDIWYSTDENPLQNFNKSSYVFPNTINSRYYLKVIDKKLEEWKLIEGYDSKRDNAFKPIRSFRNKIIIYCIEIWLIYIVGDNKNFYKNLEERIKNTK
jgi:hypothetical protein